MFIVTEYAALRPMEFSLKIDTDKPGWSTMYIEGTQDIIFPKNVFLSLKIDFVLANCTHSISGPRLIVMP